MPDTLTAEYLGQLEDLARKATPGPWRLDERIGIVAVYPGDPQDCLALGERYVHSKDGQWVDDHWHVEPDDIADAAYIAAVSPDVVLRLLALIVPGHQHEGPAMTTPREPEVVDSSCDCSRCTSRTTEMYDLPGRCLNCGARFMVRSRKGDKAPLVMCPNCVTPWKCNGPHLSDETVNVRRVQELRAALSWALGRIDTFPMTATEILDYQAAQRLVLQPTEAQPDHG